MRSRWIPFLAALCLPVAAAAQTTSDEPPAIRFGAAIQYDYLAPLGDGAEEVDTFRFRRVRLTGTGAISDDIDWAVSVEATATPVLRDAFLTLKYAPAATVRLGQLVMPFGLEHYVFSSSTMPFTERIASEVVASRDLGIVVSNAEPFFGWLSYAAAVANGTRQNTPDDNGAKDAVVRLTAAPARVPGLQVSVNAMKGEQPDGVRTRTGADVTFERKLFLVAAELDREETGGQPRKQAGFFMGAWRLYPRAEHRGFHHLELGARFARTRNLAKPLNQWDLSANYYLRENARFMCTLILHDGRDAELPGATLHARANVRF